MSFSKNSEPTVEALGFRPALRLSISGRFFRRVLRALVIGRLTVQLPSGERVEHVAAHPGPHAILVLNSWRTVRRVLVGGHLAFADAYIEGMWDSPDLATLIEFFALNQDALGREIDPSRLSRFWNQLRHRMRRNTKRGSRRNIVAHYDLGNAFYAAWLDRGMTYSSAIYAEPGLSLEAAQDAKIDKVMDALALEGGERVLEIGCGWGALAERLIRERDCAVTGLTLSPAQLAYANRRLEASRLAAKGDMRLQDYRDVQGSFDRIVSIEMLEAVGARYWPAYFAAVRDRMARGGRAVLQVITIAERYFEEYSRETDFIQKHIFPGGMLPSASVLREQIACAGLALRSAETFGASYAATLAEWQRRFQHAWPSLRGLGFDEAFRRKWEYYLSYCEAGFRAGSIDVGLYEVVHAGEGA
jgi:cyclopropane-fatty-acyl-phospholipid synthase